MNLLVDYREKDLLSKMNGLNAYFDLSLNISSINLNLGDVQITDVSNNPVVIFERKTTYDLASSIKDGRFKEQSIRLSESNDLNNHNIFYLIEGSMSSYNEKRGRLDKRSLWSAISSSSYSKGFSIYNTKDVSESAEFLLRYCDKIGRDSKNGNKREPIVYNETLKAVKKENVTKENIGTIMLSQIPGVSSRISTIIMEYAGTLKELLDICENKKNELYLLCAIDKNGKKRKISKKTIEKIINFLI